MNRLVNIIPDQADNAGGDDPNLKRISLVNLTNGEKKHLTIEPGTTPGDIIRTLNLPKRTMLTKGRGADPLAEDENIGTLPDGSVLYYGAPAIAGASDDDPDEIDERPASQRIRPVRPWHDSLTELLEKHLPRTKAHDYPQRPPLNLFPRSSRFDGEELSEQQPAYSPAIRVVKVTPLKPRPLTRSNSIMVVRPEIPYWKERGWIQTGHQFGGYYRVTRAGAWQGRAERTPSGFYNVFIRFPGGKKPAGLTHHHKSACFHQEEAFGDWFEINIIGGCKDLSAAIIECETILNESFTSHAYA